MVALAEPFGQVMVKVWVSSMTAINILPRAFTLVSGKIPGPFKTQASVPWVSQEITDKPPP